MDDEPAGRTSERSLEAFAGPAGRGAFVHSVFLLDTADRLMVLLEDGGEHVAMTFAFWIAWWVWTEPARCRVHPTG